MSIKKSYILIHKLLFGVILLSVVTGCHDGFLEEKSYSQITNENFFKTKEDAIMSVNAAYSLMAGSSYYDEVFITMADVTTDMLLSEWTNPLDSYNNLSNTDGDVKTFWNQSWKVNSQLNLALQKVPQIEMDQSIKNRVLGEASFLRALNYFNLVRFFGHIPLITEPTTDIHKMAVKQVPSDDIYVQIIKDLEFAYTNLPDSYASSDVGRATKWAAKALLAKVYLTMAGYRADPATSELIKGDDSYYSKVADICKEIIESGRYSLFKNYADVFDNDKKNTVEDIFSIQYLDGAGGYSAGVGSAKTPRFVPKGSKLAAVEWKKYAVEKLFYEKFPNDDRKKFIFLVSYLDENNAEVKMPSATLPYPFVRKYLSDIHEGSDKHYKAVDGLDYGDNYPVIRYADVLLMYSEALNEIYGPSYSNSTIENTLYGINQVRKRANATTYTIKDCNNDPDVMRALILDERCWELCYEGHGWFDYVRQGVLVDKMVVSGRASNINQHNYLMPIPYSEIQTNKLLIQNNGY